MKHWILRRGSLKHQSLPADQLRRVARLQEVLRKVNPSTTQAWVDGFLRDPDPEREIRIIEAVAAVCNQITRRLTIEDKQQVYDLLCLISAGSTSPDLATLLPADKGLPEFSVWIEMVREARAAGIRP